jgi:glycosyltransferase involved in cell wall biosynthesis
MKIAVVIPAFNEARTIGGIARRVLTVCPDVAVVDDGSQDGTAQVLAGLPVTLLRHDVNRGKAAALATGFNWALATGADAVATLDGDGQHRPEDIPRLVTVAASHPNRLIIAARLYGRDRYPRARNFANHFADFWIAWAAGEPLTDSQSGQRIYPASLLRQAERLRDRASGFTFESEIVIYGSRLGFGTVAVPIMAIHHREGRPSHFRPVRDIGRIVLMVAGYLLRSGMNPSGLLRSLGSPCIVDPPILDRRVSTTLVERRSELTGR